MSDRERFQLLKKRDELRNRLRLLNLQNSVSVSPKERQYLYNELNEIEEKLYGRHRTATQTLYGSPFGVASGGTGRTITLADYAARLLTNPPSFGAGFAREEEEPYRPPEEAGIRAGEIIAWRSWKVHEGLLTSTFREAVIWSPGQIMKAHDDPAKEQYSYRNRAFGTTHIGIFAWKELFNVTEYSTSLTLNSANYMARMMLGEVSTEPDYVIGQVLLWGSVVEHEKGYRAEFAKVHKIMIGPKVQELRERYGVAGI